ncbi:MAG TPA: dihydroorotate dehydrogenase-like protein [Cyclobacteriaceae bacterium]|nr:dihydroorotate dehydrogenase-like protein [Cyclobacteriaceae bacterium]
MDLSTKYLGMDLRTPLVVSASPLSEKLDNIRMMEDCGASAVVLYSLFEEQFEKEDRELFHHTTEGTESFAEATSYVPNHDEYRTGPDEYLDLLARAKMAVDIPIIASLNGYSMGGWTNFANMLQEAGADALELNIYYIPTDLNMSGEQVEQNYIDTMQQVREYVHLKTAVKLSPYFSNLAHFAQRLDKAGADGLVLFNRFYQPDIDLEELEVTPNIVLSKSYDMRLPLRWIAMLKGKIKANLAATSGIHTGWDVLKMMMVGADVAMLNSILLKKGLTEIRSIEKTMVEWMKKHEYESVKQMQGSMSAQNVPNPGKFERAQYMKALSKFEI